MARREHLQNSCAKGVLDPLLHERVDLAHYYQALLEATNVEILPQGGFRRRNGSRLCSDPAIIAGGFDRRLRRRLAPLPLTAAMLTAPNGGDVATLIDNATGAFVTAAVTSSPFVVVEIELPEARPVVFVDALNFSSSVGPVAQGLALEHWTGSDWAAAPGTRRFDVRTTDRRRRFGTWPGGWNGQVTTAARWRLVLYDAAGMGTLTLGRLRLWRESSQASPVRLISFARSDAETLVCALTERNIDVFEGLSYLASVPVHIDVSQVEDCNWLQSLDTLLLFHDFQPIRVTRQASKLEWNQDVLTFTNVPPLSAGTAAESSHDAECIIAITGLLEGQRIVYWIEDAMSAPVAYTGDPATFAAASQAAIGAMTEGGVLDGHVTVAVVAASPLELSVRHHGSNGDRWRPPVHATSIDSDAVSTSTRIAAPGAYAAGPVMGPTTGWPRAAALCQSRLVLGGFPSAPSTLLFSRTGGLFDFKITGSPITADLGISITLDSDRAETIREIFVGRNLHVFTQTGEWWLKSDILDATKAVEVKLATRHGVSGRVPILLLDGSTVFISNGSVLRDLLYTQEQSNYRAEPLSLLASHLLDEVRDLAHKRTDSTADGDRLVLVNSDGSAALLTLLRGQEVIAFTTFETLGAIKAAVCTAANELMLAVERSTTAGGKTLTFESYESGLWLDAATVYTGSPRTVCTRLGLHEGRSVWAYADGDLVGPFTVVGGQITLPHEATEIAVGLAPELKVRTLPLQAKLQNEQPFRGPARVFEVELSLVDTGEVLVGANGRALRPAVLDAFDANDATAGEILDVPLMERLFTGKKIVGNLRGFSDEAIVEIGQTRPAPLTVRSIRYGVSY